MRASLDVGASVLTDDGILIQSEKTSGRDDCGCGWPKLSMTDRQMEQAGSKHLPVPLKLTRVARDGGLPCTLQAVGTAAPQRDTLAALPAHRLIVSQHMGTAISLYCVARAPFFDKPLQQAFQQAVSGCCRTMHGAWRCSRAALHRRWHWLMGDPPVDAVPVRWVHLTASKNNKNIYVLVGRRSGAAPATSPAAPAAPRPEPGGLPAARPLIGAQCA